MKWRRNVCDSRGEVGDSFFVLASGRVRVERKRGDSSEVVLARLTDGAFSARWRCFKMGKDGVGHRRRREPDPRLVRRSSRISFNAIRAWRGSSATSTSTVCCRRRWRRIRSSDPRSRGASTTDRAFRESRASLKARCCWSKGARSGSVSLTSWSIAGHEVAGRHRGRRRRAWYGRHVW